MFRFWHLDVGVRWRVGRGLGLEEIRTFMFTSVLATTFLTCSSFLKLIFCNVDDFIFIGVVRSFFEIKGSHVFPLVKTFSMRLCSSCSCLRVICGMVFSVMAMYARWSEKKYYFGDPAWKMQIEKMPEMQVLKAWCVQKPATPRKGSSLVYSTIPLQVSCPCPASWTPNLVKSLLPQPHPPNSHTSLDWFSSEANSEKIVAEVPCLSWCT